MRCRDAVYLGAGNIFLINHRLQRFDFRLTEPNFPASFDEKEALQLFGVIQPIAASERFGLGIMPIFS